MKMRLRYAAVLVALLFVTAAVPAPAAAEDGWHCHACEMCYSPTPFCTSCGVMTLNALSGCCGMGNGEAYCVPDYGGFAVNCDSGRACQCDMDGDVCNELTLAGG